jgi:glycosyltransferase involved in cell wall biosynthesis
MDAATGDRRTTVLVPVYQAEAFLAETIDALLAQTHRDFVALLSVDASRDRSLDLARSYERDPRVRVYAQPRRLGWVGNGNWLLRRVRTPFYCILPHDDTIAPEYLERLHRLLELHPRAAVAYTDLEGYGLHEKVYVQEPVLGERHERVLDFVRAHLAAVAYRGLVRAAVAGAPPIPDAMPHDLFADTLWMAKLARRGELVRHPEILYRKRYHAESAHAGWLGWSDSERAELWRAHCEALAAIFLRDLTLGRKAWRIRDAWRCRLRQKPVAFYAAAPVTPRSREPDLVRVLGRWLRHRTLR